MNKHILADIVTEKLKREIGMVARPLPEALTPLEKVLPSGKQRYRCELYQAEKLKKISIIRTQRGETSAGTVVMIIGEEEYDLPFVLVAVGFVSGEKSKLAVEFEAMPLFKDEESVKKYVDPFRKWREALGKLPSEPITGFSQPGEVWTSNLSPTDYLQYVPDEYTDEVLNFAQQFFDIFLDIYRKEVPVKNAERRRQMDAFRSEFNRHILEEDPDGVILTETFGRQTAELFYDYLIYL
jgi:hypothetical protein